MIPENIQMKEGTILRDESLFSGKAESLSAPETVEQVCCIINHCRENGMPVTVRGALTAMNGAGVPLRGHSMSMERLNQVEYDPETQTIWAQAGANFQLIEQTVRKESAGKREFAAAPTEKTATIGGALSFATSGIRARRCGTVAQQVLELEYCDSTGNLHRITREDKTMSDLLGSEGMCAVITGVRLATTEAPDENWGLIFFLDSEDRTAEFAGRIQNLPGVSVLEYLDSGCLNLMKTVGREITAVSRLPEPPSGAVAAIYLELEAEDDAQMEEFAEGILVEADAVGADPDCSWSTVGVEVEKFRELHHAIQDCINLKTSRYHKEDAVVTRLTYPVCAKSALERRQELAGEGLEAVVFGHWDETLPLGIHIFAENAQQYRKAKEIMARWYREDAAQGCIAVPQRGVGKVYRDVLTVERLQSLKSAYDPEGLLNPGNGYE